MRLLAAGLAVLALGSAGCAGAAAGDPPSLVREIEADPKLADLSRQLTGGIPKQPDDVRALMTGMATSVQDMSRLDADAFERAHGRSASDQAQLVGSWLGTASEAVRGGRADAELADAARDVPGGPSDVSTDGGRPAVARDVAARLSSLAPNEPTDNPQLPGAESLRSTLQSAFAAAAD